MEKPFDFSDIKQEDDEINLNDFLDIAKNDKTTCFRTPVFDVIVDGHRHKFSIILKGEIIIDDGELLEVNGIYKNAEDLANCLTNIFINTMNR